MRNPLNKKVTSLTSSGIRRFFEIAAMIEDVISLGVGEPDFDTPWHVREEAITKLRQGSTFYSPNAGLYDLRVGIADFNKRKYQLDYDPKDEIIVTVGCSEGIDLALRTMIDNGDEVIVLDPSYVSYIPTITLAGGVPVLISLDEKEKFRLTPEKLEAAITPKTKMVIISYPNNPTGAIMEKEDLEKIAEVIKKHDIFVLSDEIYSELTYTDTPHYSIANIEGMKERTIVLNGFSKAFAMTGWRLGYALGPAIVINEMIKIHQYTVIAPSTVGQYAGIVAISDCDDEIEYMRTSYNQRRRYLLSMFESMNLECFEPEGAFYVFLNIKKFGLSSNDFCERLLREHKLAIVPGSAFGEGGEGFVRISYAYSIEELQEAMNRLKIFIDTI
ncbi:aminotransferase class I/II-fold pyridoxal phosphate-dependent enzyme [Carnobacteriaceae bacterium zg-84]|uniref:pyridoxal phosphate-dependent aminotransferase n=1 Tax=Granulicatella sp. zg-84 TaxID=2678503 RepID=UPI0013C06D11|nr:aminotransferase class I/II-fold pyridoxal phosphate-dependent enzyme [Granulicatella sp. zg-84]NEW66146.1 aminotransferase class I/II-fold pyridoxal phosphate-dependent enzyme [Granulicatella sp. zg-84]QMI86096.1 aminotransferase class I/II-fold pyridoxal phosphate-dependent enzyme [Carnobacteriaceae bacterium zg-84]